jgi:hypothetical protein
MMMFSSIVAPAFQPLAAVYIRNRDDEEHNRSGEEDDIRHGSNSFGGHGARSLDI